VATGVFFSGFTDTASPYAIDDILTLSCGSSNPTKVRVVECGNFANSTPLCNITDSVVSTLPTYSTMYGDYYSYTCTGGSGT